MSTAIHGAFSGVHVNRLTRTMRTVQESSDSGRLRPRPHDDRIEGGAHGPPELLRSRAERRLALGALHPGGRRATGSARNPRHRFRIPIPDLHPLLPGAS